MIEEPKLIKIEAVLPSDYLPVAIDIGGSLAKIAYFADHVEGNTAEKENKKNKVKFAKFQTENLNEYIDFLKDIRHRNKNCKESVKRPNLIATGGGAFRYQDVLEKELEVNLVKEDELDSLVYGSNYLLNSGEEVFKFSNSNKVYLRNVTYPYLLVNIGSGVSILKVDGPEKYDRISGTSLGGGTFRGIMTLLSGVKNFDEMLDMCKNGNNNNVDMLVGDIYGKSYSKVGLKETTIASSLGKLSRRLSCSSSQGQKCQNINNDVAKSLLFMISNNIGQISYLNASKYNIKSICFAGFFIRGQAYTMNTLTYAINFWSGGKMDALFYEHEGYHGAIGALLKNINI